MTSNNQGEVDGGWPCEVRSWQPVREKRERERASEREERERAGEREE